MQILVKAIFLKFTRTDFQKRKASWNIQHTAFIVHKFGRKINKKNFALWKKLSPWDALLRPPAARMWNMGRTENTQIKAEWWINFISELNSIAAWWAINQGGLQNFGQCAVAACLQYSTFPGAHPCREQHLTNEWPQNVSGLVYLSCSAINHSLT